MPNSDSHGDQNQQEADCEAQPAQSIAALNAILGTLDIEIAEAEIEASGSAPFHTLITLKSQRSNRSQIHLSLTSDQVKQVIEARKSGAQLWLRFVITPSAKGAPPRVTASLNNPTLVIRTKVDGA